MRQLSLLFLLAVLVSGADGDMAGRWAGDWKSANSGDGGTFHMLLDSTGGAWKCEITFALGGEDVKTTVRSVKVEQSKLEVQYDFEAQGVTLRSRISGQLKDNSFDGRYQTAIVDGAAVDEGTWKAARAKAQ